MLNTSTSLKQIKTWIRKLIPYASLGLTLIAISRQGQILQAQAALTKQVSYFRNSTQNKACHIAKDSILRYYEEGKGKTLIIILDAYPSESLYKVLTGKNSRLHAYLKEKSSEWRENYTPYPYTMYSLAYLLGGVNHPAPDCHYPFFGTNAKPARQLIGNLYIQNDNQFCKEAGITKAAPILVRIANKLKNEKGRCTILLRQFNVKLSRLIAVNKNGSGENGVEILHDTGYHDILEKPINEQCQEKAENDKNIDLIDQLENADACYMASINTILHNQNKAEMYDRIIIMSDHGPRIPIPLLQTERFFNTSFAGKAPNTRKMPNKGSLVDKNYYQFFSYGINITGKAKGEKIRVPENSFNQNRYWIEWETDQPRLLGR